MADSKDPGKKDRADSVARVTPMRPSSVVSIIVNGEKIELRNLNVFKKAGDVWMVRFQGRTKHIPDSVGLAYIRLLLSEQGRTFTTGEFLSLYNGNPVNLAGADKRLDEEAMKNYKNKLNDIENLLLGAKKNNDPAEQERLEDKKASIIAELARAVGFGKRSKKLNPEFDKYRLSIGNAIVRGIDKIAEHLPDLEKHLKKAISSPHSGISLSYRPSEPINWVL